MCFRCLEEMNDLEINSHIDDCLSMKEIDAMLGNECKDPPRPEKKGSRQLSLEDYLAK